MRNAAHIDNGMRRIRTLDQTSSDPPTDWIIIARMPFVISALIRLNGGADDCTCRCAKGGAPGRAPGISGSGRADDRPSGRAPARALARRRITGRKSGGTKR